MPFFMRLPSEPPYVLIVNAEPDICLSITNKLTAKGYEVESGPDGKTCLELIQHQAFDAVLLSEHLPDMDGLSLLNVIRIRRPTFPVIFLAGSGPSPIAIQRGAFAVLGLPHTKDELYDILQRAIGR